jgi:hypothetical protein
MSELPGRPNLDQLRRQARELLRAAAGGEPSAQTRIGAVSERVTLSAAQLALAREYGFTSWPALHAEVARRRVELPPEGTGRAGTRWSFGGAAAIETAAGTLYPGGLVAGPEDAVLAASLTPSAQAWYQFPAPPWDSSTRETWHSVNAALIESVHGGLALTDDQGTAYTLHISQLSPGSDHERGLVSLQLTVDPVPAPGRGWLELRGQGGSAARLLPSAHQGVSVSRLVPVPGGRARRELSQEALGVIGLQLLGADPEELGRYCSAAVARAAEIQRSGPPGAAGDLPAQLARLCAALTGSGPVDGLPAPWAGIIEAAGRRDGAPLHLDLSAALPSVDDTVVRVDCLISEPGSWQVHLRAEPGWWAYSADGNRKRAVFSVHAEDDRGGLYLSQFGGSAGRPGLEELIMTFQPRLDPLARALTLIFSHGGEQATVALPLP